MNAATVNHVQQQLREYEIAAERASHHTSLDLALGATLAAMQHLAWAITALLPIDDNADEPEQESA